MMKKNKKYLLALIILLSIPVYFFVPQSIIIQKNLTIVKELRKDDVNTSLRHMFDRNYNFTEIIEWVHTKLRFVPMNETMEKRPTNPLDILEYGKGRCGEFSILYVATCLAHGYQSRLIISYNIIGFEHHAWAEVKLNGSWVHVDPSDKVWDEKERYHKGGFETWGNFIGTFVRVYSFDDNICADITYSYD